MTFRGISEERVIFIDVNGVTKNQSIEKAVARRCSVKKMFLEISQNSKQKHLRQSLFFDKIAGQAKLQHLFYRTLSGGCFWTLCK